MNEVSNASVIFLRDACARAEISFEEMTRGLSGLERIDGPGRIDWNLFAELLERFVQRVGLAALERAGARTVDDAFAESIRVIAGAFASSRLLYRAIVRWFSPAAIHDLGIAYRDLPEGRVEIAVEIPVLLRPSLPFFHMALGSYRAAPRLLGQSDALVDMQVTARRAVYTISPPPDLTLLSRARRAVKVAVGTRRAIEELSRQQEQLRTSYQDLFDSRRDLRNVIDRVPVGILIRQRGVLVYANPTFVATVGAELLGRWIEDLVDPSWREKVLAKLDEPDPQPDAGPTEIPFVHANGHPLTLEVHPPQKIDFDGQTSQLLVAHDITARKELEVKALLTERMASIGTIAAGVAHEINNPLTYVIDGVRRIHETLSTPGGLVASQGELEQMAAEAVGGIERVEVIVRDLKTFAHAGADELVPVDVRGVLESAARMAVSEIRHKARLVSDLEDVPFALANTSRLGQVLLNVIVNAAQAIPEGNVAGNEIRISARRVGERVAIEVKDTGTGISRENLPKIFQPFFTTKPAGVGTGLGLAICHSIVGSMKGEIAVQSEVGVGTTFRVLLNVARLPPPAKLEMGPTARADAGSKRILIVDDERAVANSLKRVVRGHDVTIALNGEDALRALGGAPFDVVFCDLMMPGMSGMDLYERLGAEQKSRFVFVTGGAFTARAQTFLARVANEKVDKPFNATLVREIVARAGGRSATGGGGG